jgi:hypothetical protein
VPLDTSLPEARPIAVIESSSAPLLIRRLLFDWGYDSACEILDHSSARPGRPRYEIRARSADRLRACADVRAVLGVFLDAADSGIVERFRIVQGADLLRRDTSPGAPAVGWSTASRPLHQ